MLEKTKSIKTGRNSLDQLTGGFKVPSLIILGSRPGVGKTTLGLNIASNIAYGDTKIGIFSLEMTANTICENIIFGKLKLVPKIFSQETLTEEEINKIEELITESWSENIVISDIPGLPIDDLCEIARDWKKTKGIEFLFIDYLQLIAASKDGKTRYDEISEIMIKLKDLSKELEIVILCLSQISRGNIKKNKHTPSLNDLPSSVEDECDTAMILYRESYYDLTDQSNSAQLHILKNRSGNLDKCELLFNKSNLEFENVPKMKNMFG